MSVRYYNFEKIHNDNLVVGYYIDKAIVKNENGYLFYIECDENELRSERSQEKIC